MISQGVLTGAPSHTQGDIMVQATGTQVLNCKECIVITFPEMHDKSIFLVLGNSQACIAPSTELILLCETGMGYVFGFTDELSGRVTVALKNVDPNIEAHFSNGQKKLNEYKSRIEQYDTHTAFVADTEFTVLF